ncbi:conserved hypothetical protein [Chloroherpeton thalassium ATCC 35110]|uniref:Uncharacterized protein n=1 Tax=Chloroherpeton thalassium (strain ATCC 35110 / GB-78) TaxID=517418 RepID=B3QWS3_CHLT3|nr:hypothetical protein [Chloroherpeton thalassium]ACF13287.1 conserved hypothetical protein [Chloroherpeton thalassium ATCC 35110]
MEVQNRPLGLVMQMVEEMGSEVTYAYDDLVFINHNAFIIQFTETPILLKVYFNKDYQEAQVALLTKGLIEQAGKNGLEVQVKGTYELEQKEDENIEIKFFDKESE